MNFGQIKAFVAVYECGSFSAAAVRENATQSGLSMQVQKLEQRLEARLFERTPRGIRSTVAGARLYDRAVAVLSNIDAMQQELRALSDDVSGVVDIGLMPTLTRGALAPVLSAYVDRYPNVELRIIEAYSNALTEQVVAGQLDFAVVPPLPRRAGLTARLIGRDREILLSSAAANLTHLKPVRLAALAPLKLVVPLAQNARRPTLEAYIATHGVRVERRLEMDAMIGTLDFVANSDWVTILPGTICANEIADRGFTLSPVADPPITSEFVAMRPARRPLSQPARLFADALAQELARIAGVWDSTLARPPSTGAR